MEAAPTLRCLDALDVFGFQPFFTGDDLEGNDVAFIQVFESLPGDGRVMHKNVLPGTLADEPEPLFIVEPFDFAAGHNDSLICEAVSKK
jgi:hypothetical protein